MQPKKTKKIPTRMCIVCREMKEKSKLIRIVINKDGEIFVDKTQRANGRGAYLCNNKDCIKTCIEKKILNKVFKKEIPEEIYQSILGEYGKESCK